MRFASHGTGFLLLLLATASPAAAQQKPTLAPADYGRWESAGFATLSRDGHWLAVPISRVDEENELRIHRTNSDSVVVSRYGSQAAFSRDSRWAAWLTGFSPKEQQAAQKADRVLRSKLALLDLSTGGLVTIDDIASFSFSGDGRYLAMRGYAAKDQKTKGVDLIVRDLAVGTHTSFGDVAESRWQDEGRLLAFVIDAVTRAGNGVKLYDPATGVLRTLDTDSAGFRGLVWRRKADDLAVFRIRNDSLREAPTHVVRAWTGLAGRSPASHTFDPATMRGFPGDTRVVEFRPLSWSHDGRILFLGTQAWQAKEKPAEDSAQAANGRPEAEKPGVEIWHARDVDILPEQKVRAQRDRERNRLVAWHLDPARFVPVENESIETATPARRGAIATVTDPAPYDRERMFGPAYSDFHIVNLDTGERTRVKERVQYTYGSSPTGRYAIYLENDHYWVYDVAKRTTTNITRAVPTSFVNLDDDHTVEQKPPFGVAGWTPDDRSVLLYDKYDIWEISPDGSKSERLSNGSEERIRHRIVFLGTDEDFRDVSKPTYVALYGETSKKYGYGTVQRGKRPERRVWLDGNVSRLTRAEDADAYSYLVQAFDDSPDYFVGDGRLAGARQVGATNPFQKDYAWGRAELVDFENREGRPLQAGLFYPADYEPGRKYPMIVYVYEIVSNQLHNYWVPSERSAYNPAVWTQAGYFVLMPDIVYRERNPGVSAVDCIVPAVEKIVSMGLVDEKKIGLVGHSWGGYQTAFVSTVTSTFAAGVAGAPLTELASMYLSVYWNTGGTDARIFEISQGRMEVPPWKDLESYTRNSAVWNIEQMETPLLVTFGDKDGAVDWHQGIVMYNAARRENKDLVLLVYEGENHGLAKKPNQIDYHRRIMAWFGHYLKDEPAPDWMTKGIRYLDRDKELERAVAARPVSNGRE